MPPRRRTRNETPPVGEDEGASSGLINTLEQFFRQFNTNSGPRIDYDKARKNGAQPFSHAEEPMDAHNWIENMERVFTQISCPEELKVNLAVQFLQRGAWHWWTETRRGMGVEADQMSWDQFSTLFKGRYISQAHINRMREEFLNLEKGDMTVMVFEQRFMELAHYVPDLVKTEQDRIYQFIRGLGGVYADSMAAVPYMSFSQAVIAALNIEARNLSTGRRLEFGGPSQGPAKRAASTSGSGSSVGSGHGSSSSSSPRFHGRFRGRNRRLTRNQLGGRQSGQFRSGMSSQSGASGGQSFQFGQNQFQPVGCFQCGQPDHFRRECPLLAQNATPTVPASNQATTQTSAGASSSGTRTSFPARGTSQQGRGLRGRPTTHARLHAMTQQEGRTSPEVIMGREETRLEESSERRQT